MSETKYSDRKIDIERYIYKLIPDYAYIDYAEKMYWTNHVSHPENMYTDALYDPSDSDWYNIINILFETYNSYKIIGYGRCLLISPVHLEFESHVDEIIVELKKYGDRYVYACFSSEDELNRRNFAFRGVDAEVKNYQATGDFPYVFMMRF